MPLLVPTRTPYGEFQTMKGSHLTTQPSTAFGATITPGNNAWGSAVQIGADLTLDAYGILININSVGVSGAAKDGILQLGFDFTGGTTFPASPNEFNSISLLCSSAAGTVAGGVSYWFPLFIPAGTAILGRGRVNNATVGSMRVYWQTFCQPKNPEAVRVGRYVCSVGAVEASSRGTLVTPGTTSEGSWTSLGSLPADRPCWYWELGHGVGSTTMANGMVFAELSSDASGARVLVKDSPLGTTTAEAVTKPAAIGHAGLLIGDVAGGTTLHGRAQASGTAPTGYSMMAYGVGG